MYKMNCMQKNVEFIPFASQTRKNVLCHFLLSSLEIFESFRELLAFRPYVSFFFFLSLSLTCHHSLYIGL